MAPLPGRMAATLRITMCALIVIVLSETFQVSGAATNAYFTYILFKPDANAAVRLTLLGAVAILTGIFTTIVFFMATLSEPALRIPLMAVLTFAAMFLTRASTIDPVAMVAGLFMVNSLTKGDNLSQNGSNAYYPTNTDTHGLPSSLFISDEEAMVHALLWEALGVVIAVVVVVLVNKLTAPDPEKSLRAALADRIAAAFAFCAGEDGARTRLVTFARAGTASLKAQSSLLGHVKRVPQLVAAGNNVIAATSRLMLTLLAFERLPREQCDHTALQAWVAPLSISEAAVRDSKPASHIPNETPPVPINVSASVAPLLAQVRECVFALQEASSKRAAPASAKARLGFLKPDAFTDLVNTQFALKTTLALMTCYVFMNLADWSQISTCMTTCFVLSTETAGQSFQKMVARVGGAAIGGGLGFLAILYVMPVLTDIGQLLLFVAPVLFAAAWIRAGGDRINYVGQQMAFAFMLMVLQNYGPTLNYDTGRDRVVGILVGELVVTLVFTQIWPVRVADAVRGRIGDALAALGGTLRTTTLSRNVAVGAVQNFGERIGATRGLLVDDPFEPEDFFRRHGGRGNGSGRIDDEVLAALQAVAIPLEIVTDMAAAVEPKDEQLGRHRRDLAEWVGKAEAWVRHGRDAQTLERSLPSPPVLNPLATAPDARVSAAWEWYAILDRELREVLRKAQTTRRAADAIAS